jgi:L-threonylcarbamoyladenylate synthase
MAYPEILSIANEDAAVRAATVLHAGGLVVVPTDTVYGLAAALDRPDALRRIYEVKGRSETNPLPVLLAEPAMFALAGAEPAPVMVRFAEQFWPGPLTLVVPARLDLPAEVVGPGRSVGLRVPDQDGARRVISLAGGALAVTSANRSGQPPAESAHECLSYFGSSVDLILDGGPSPGGTASTVARVADGHIEILRAGPILLAELERAWTEAATDGAEP